ncbi:MAG: RNA polymerase sigma factor [Candidatus Acidiferrales bacterium]
MEVDKLTAVHVKDLYQKHGGALAAYACCCGLDFASAEDAVQQVFLKLLHGETSVPRTPVAYLYRAVRNVSFNLHRDRKHETEFVGGEHWFVHFGGAPEEVFTLQAALRELPDEQREVVFLRIWSGLTLQEIADSTKLPINTVASRYRYALEKLRERLNPEQVAREQNAES